MTSLVTMLACGVPCRPAAALPIRDPDGAGSATVARVRAAVGEWSAWTGRDTICATEIEVRDSVREGWHDLPGRFHRGSGRIEIASWTEGDERAFAVRRELCEALDADEDLSWPHRELFESVPLPPERASGTRRERVRQGFAEACAEAPSTTLADCDGRDDPQRRFLLGAVWRGWDAGYDWGGVPADWSELDELPTSGLPGWYRGLPAGVGSAAVVPWFDPEGALYLERFDPRTGARLTPLTAPGEPFADAVLVGGDGDPVWIALPSEEARPYGVHADGLAPLSAELPGFTHGAVALGGLVLYATLPYGDALVRYDLDDAALTELAVPDGEEVVALGGGPGGLAAVFAHEGGWRVGATRDGVDWETVELPEGLHATDVAPLADGSVAIAWSQAIAGAATGGFGVLRDGRLILADDACAAGVPVGNLFVVEDDVWWISWGSSGTWLDHPLLAQVRP